MLTTTSIATALILYHIARFYGPLPTKHQVRLCTYFLQLLFIKYFNK